MTELAEVVAPPPVVLRKGYVGKKCSLCGHPFKETPTTGFLMCPRCDQPPR